MEKSRIGIREKGWPVPSFGVLWSHTNFMRLWIGESISLLGSQVTTLALPLTAIVLFKANSAQVGLLSAAESIPFLFLPLFAGMWVDRRRHLPILIGSNISRGVLLSLIPLCAIVGWLSPEVLYAVAFLVGCLTVFFSLAYQAFLPVLVQREHLVEGNSKLSASQSIAEIGGPGLAGFLIQLVSAPLAICVDVLSFFVAGACLGRIRITEPTTLSSREKPTLTRDLFIGFRLTFTNPYLRAFVGEAATYNFFWQLMLAVLILYLVNELHYTSGSVGLLFAMGSMGALCGALLGNVTARRLGIGLTIVVAAALADLPMLALPYVSDFPLWGLLTLMALFFFQGMGMTGCNVHVGSIRQVLIPQEFQGRVYGSYRILVSGALPLGSLLGGGLGMWVGLRTTLIIGAVGLLFTWLWILFSPVPRLRNLPTKALDLSAYER